MTESRRARREQERADRKAAGKQGAEAVASPPAGSSRGLFIGMLTVIAILASSPFWFGQDSANGSGTPEEAQNQAAKDSQTGDSQTGESQTGESQTGESQTGESQEQDPKPKSDLPTIRPAMPKGTLDYRIVNTYPHDPTSFTQGLDWHDGYLYETTGQYGQSRLLKVDLKTGKPVQEHKLPDKLFGEGMTLMGDKIYQITYKAQTGIVYDAKTFEELRRFSYPGEGWGLASNGKHLVMSNGSRRLTFLDPETLDPIRSVDCTDTRLTGISRLNELEYYRGGEVLANLWGYDLIARIDPKNGDLLGIIDLQSLRAKGGITAKNRVLNGIAYDYKSDRLFVTGKHWPKLFEIEVFPRLTRNSR